LTLRFRARATSTNSPILQLQVFDAAERDGVVRDEPQSQSARVGRDEGIIGANHLPAAFQVRTYLGVVGRRVVRKLENLDVRQKCVQRRGVLRSPR
jgi:hypothetical protein